MDFSARGSGALDRKSTHLPVAHDTTMIDAAAATTENASRVSAAAASTAIADCVGGTGDGFPLPP